MPIVFLNRYNKTGPAEDRKYIMVCKAHLLTTVAHKKRKYGIGHGEMTKYNVR